MRSPNRKHKPKHMTKIKYRRIELDWILVYQKNSKRLSVKPPFESYNEYMDNCNILFNKDEVLAPLLKAGYYQNMRTNEEFDSSFKSKELWIIGQIMSCFHPILVNKIKNLYEMND